MTCVSGMKNKTRGVALNKPKNYLETLTDTLH